MKNFSGGNKGALRIPFLQYLRRPGCTAKLLCFHTAGGFESHRLHQSEPEKSSCRIPACFLLMPARRLIAFHRSDSRPRWSGEVHLRSRLDKLRLARPLEERESRTPLPRLRPPPSDTVLQRHVVDSRLQRFVLLLALPMPRKIPQVRARSKNHIDPRDRRNLFRVFHADGSLNHNHHHHVLVGDLAIVASPQGPVLPVAL